jgi:hypothetical protein
VDEKNLKKKKLFFSSSGIPNFADDTWHDVVMPSKVTQSC